MKEYKNIETMKLKYLEKHKMKHLSYLIDQVYFQHIIKKTETLTNKSPAQIYVKKTQNRIIFKIKIACYLELLTPEDIKEG